MPNEPEIYDLLQTLTSLSALSVEISVQLEEYDLLVLVLQWIMRATDALHGAIYLYDEVTDAMTVTVVEGKGCPPRGFRESASEGLLGEMMRTQQTVHTSNYGSYAQRRPEWPLNAAAVAPLIAREQVLGAIAIGAKSTRPIDAIALHLLTLLAVQAATVLDNRRLFRAERQKTHQLHLLNEITYASSSYNNVDELLQFMAETLNGLFDSDLCFISLWDAENNLPIPVAASAPLWDAYRASTLAPGSTTLTAQVMADRTPIFIPNVRESDLVNPDLAKRFPGTSMLGLPLIMGESGLGAVFLGFNKHRHVTADELRMSRQIADQVALVLARVQLLAWERKRRSLTETQLVFSQELLTTTSVAEAADLLLAATANFVGFDTGAVMLFDNSRRLAHIAASKGYTDPIAAREKSIPMEDYPLLRQLADNISPIYIPDVRQNDFWKPSETNDPREWRSILFMPLHHHRDYLVGSLTLKCHQPDAFSQADRSQLQLLCNLAAATLQNHRLLRQSRSQAEELIAAYDSLQGINQIRKDMVHNASHELRTPLTFIQGYAGMLDDGMLGPLNEDQKEAAKIILKRAESMNKMIEEMVVGQENETTPLTRTKMDLVELVQSCTKAAQLTAHNAGVVFEIHLTQDLPPLFADAQRMGQVVDNLLTNAIKFSPNGGTVRISLGIRGELATLQVADEGLGIPQDELNRIWDRHYRVKSTAEIVGGKGLGLNIVRHIVEAHGGQIWAESPGKGSVFHVELPILTSTTG